ncbi:MAG: hypothetical protein HOM18_10975 [Candidatus Marinimicrobia bacterium]|nr:hypothetical protein [Candidatus Neomarinimicrobiota bacterium]
MSAVKNYTDIDIASNALLLIGESPIASFTEDTVAALIAANLYSSTFESLLTLHPWRFASTKATLSRLTAAPVNQWKYAYQLPADFLVAQHIDEGNDNYQIYADKLYSDNTTMVLDYTYKPDESFLPAYFTQLLELRLASVFAIPITESATRGDYYAGLAEKQLQRSKTIDSQSTPSIGPPALEGSRLINSRY